MAMENKRIIQLSTERTNLTSGDYVMVDSDADGSAKYRLERLKETDTTLSVSGMAADAAATGQAINAEATARGNAVTAEASARQSADTTLQGNITAEAQARAAADTALGDEVDDLKSAYNNVIGDYYNCETIASYVTAADWKLNSNTGLSVSDLNYNIYKYKVSENTIIRVGGCEFYQFQNAEGVPSNPPSNRVGTTHENNELSVVPNGASYLIVSALKSATVEVKEMREKISDIESLERKLTTTTRNLLDIDNWVSVNDTMQISDGIATNVVTDTRSLILYVATRNNGSAVETIYSAAETVRHRKHTFAASGNADTIRFTASGQIKDLIIEFKGLSISSGTTYTISYDITGANTSAVGGFILENIQLELGSSETEYIPHITAVDFVARDSIQALSGTIDEAIEKIDETEFVNLIDKTSSMAGIITNGRVSSSANAKTCFAKLEVGKKYVLYQSIKDSSILIVACSAGTALYSEVAQTVTFKLGFRIVQQENDKCPYVFTVPSGYPYFAVTYYDASNDTDYTETELLNSLYVTEYGGANSVLSDTAHDIWANNPIVSVFSDEVASVSNEITAKTTSKALLIGIITDTHINAINDTYIKVSSRNMESVCKNVSFDIAANLGDVIDGGGTKAQEREYMRHGISYLLSVGGKKSIAVAGNHDNNGLNPNELFDDADLYGMMLRISETEFTRDGIYDNAYIDYSELNLRVIFVDSVYNTGGFSAETVSWLSSVLADTPSNYRFVFLSHEPTRWSLISTASGSMYNSSEMESLLSQYVDRICGWIHGHTHFDNVSYVTTFPQISITCGQPYQYPSTNLPSGAVAPSRTIGTVTQDAWDSVLVLPDENKFEFVRFGAGNSRTVPFRQ